MMTGGGLSVWRSGTPSVIPTPATVADTTNKTEAIQITGRAWVNPANDKFNGIQTIRWNRGSIVRYTNHSPAFITFYGRGCPGADGFLSVVYNSALFATITVPLDASQYRFDVPGFPVGPKTIEIWEDFQERPSPLNTGVDGPLPGTYVTAVVVPPGTTVAPATCTTGAIVSTESQSWAIPNTPSAWNGPFGQLRALGHANGWLVASDGYSTFSGDGRTPAQAAQCWADMFTAMGSPATRKIIYWNRPNDGAYANLSGFAVTPTQGAANIAATFDAYVGLAGANGLTVDLVTPPLMGTGQQGPYNGFTISDWATAIATVATGRSYIRLRDGLTVWNSNLGTDYHEAGPNQVHWNQSGSDKAFAVARTWWGL
jgi:hypothetical protein